MLNWVEFEGFTFSLQSLDRRVDNFKKSSAFCWPKKTLQLMDRKIFLLPILDGRKLFYLQDLKYSRLMLYCISYRTARRSNDFISSLLELLKKYRYSIGKGKSTFILSSTTKLSTSNYKHFTNWPHNLARKKPITSDLSLRNHEAFHPCHRSSCCSILCCFCQCSNQDFFHSHEPSPTNNIMRIVVDHWKCCLHTRWHQVLHAPCLRKAFCW